METGNNKSLAFALTLIISVVGMAQAAGDPVTPVCQIDWERFLARHDLVWNAVPATWDDSVFLGNGLMGELTYTKGRNELGWGIGRSDVTDHQQGPEPLLRTPRLPIGRLVLEPAGKIQGGSARLDLWNATADSIVRTDKVEIHWHSFVHAQEMVLVVTLTTTSGGGWYGPATASASHGMIKSRLRMKTGSDRGGFLIDLDTVSLSFNAGPFVDHLQRDALVDRGTGDCNP